jgi:hypothetical protein
MKPTVRGPDSAPALTPCQTLYQGAYYHELFLRSKRFLCKRMKRTLNKTSGPNASQGEDDPAPDFYAMPSLPEELCTAAASPTHNEGLFRRQPRAQGGWKKPPGSFGKDVDARGHEGGLASPAALVSSSLRSDAPSRAISSTTQQLTWSHNHASLFHHPRVVPSAPSLVANVGEYAGSLHPRWLLDRRALLSQHAATAVAALLTSQAQTRALQQLASSLSAFPSGSGPFNIAQAPADHPNLARLPRSRNDYQPPFTPQLSRALPLTPLQAFLQQQQLLRQLQSQSQSQSQPEQRQRQGGSEESKSTDLAAFMEAYMRRYNESKDSY